FDAGDGIAIEVACALLAVEADDVVIDAGDQPVRGSAGDKANGNLIAGGKDALRAGVEFEVVLHGHRAGDLAIPSGVEAVDGCSARPAGEEALQSFCRGGAIRRYRRRRSRSAASH